MADPSPLTLPYQFHPGGSVIGAGQPDAGQWQQVAAAGIGDVINLRPLEEQPGDDEAAQVTALGMRYHHLPIAGAQDFSPQTVRALDALLAQAGDAPVLLHCATSNRVGALMALRAGWLQGAAPEAALALGRDYGMTRLEPLVRALLAAGEAGVRTNS